MNSPLQTHSKLVVLGNGPSLKGFDLKSLSDVDSLGMNAAYRYWDRIGWYPTHYVCLDDQLIETHANAIYDLIVNDKVNTAFLIAKILDYHPDLIARSNVFYLESFHTVRQQRVADRGIKYIKSVPFMESNSSKVTTGAYSVRYGAYLGYKQISILGVDLRYVEILPEAESQGGNKLLVKSTPSNNPNYFFDDYQREGDKYNIPNPASHGKNLHISSFEYLAIDTIKYGWDAKVYNSNRSSVLYDRSIFPYIDISTFTAVRALSAVVIPSTLKEVRQLSNNLKAWDHPMLVPSCHTKSTQKPDLVYAFSGNEDADLEHTILEAVNKTAYVRSCFDDVRVIFVGLDQSLDYYEKDYSKAVSGRGHKSGPNEQFFELMRTLSCYSGFVFYMEADCTPLRRGWLDEITILAENDKESWVIGSYYRGVQEISERFKFHLNGNALYRVGDPEFITFIESYWRKELYRVIDTEDRRIAYDCVLSYIFTEASPQNNNAAWKVFQQVGHRFRATSVIQNISGENDRKLNSQQIIQDLLVCSPTTYIVHGAIFQEQLNKLIQLQDNDSNPLIAWDDTFDHTNSREPPVRHSWQSHVSAEFPRLLMIDSTPVGHKSATGQLKKTFLGDWPEQSFIQLWDTGGSHSQLRLFELGVNSNSSSVNAVSLEDAVRICSKFRPEVIYFRPIDSELLFLVAETMVEEFGCPLIVHMMDDWPERLKNNDRDKFRDLDSRLRKLLNAAVCRLSISKDMSEAYGRRYGGTWYPLANGVDLAESPAKDWATRPNISHKFPFVIRYMGGLADDMTYDSIHDIASVISMLQNSLPVRFEIYTMNWYLSRAEEEIGKLPGVTVHPLVQEESYRHTLASSDALVVAYNFDQASISYTALSLSNKMPECLAAGVPLIAYGPAHVATIRYLNEIGCAEVVVQRDTEQLKKTIINLVENISLCQRLGESGRAHVSERLTKQMVQRRFLNYLTSYQRGNPEPEFSTSSNRLVLANSIAHLPVTRARQSFRIQTGPNFKALGPYQWYYTHTKRERSLWIASIPSPESTTDRSFIGWLRVMSDQTITLDISLGRDGKTPYEGSSQRIKLDPGVAQEVKIPVCFTRDYSAFKLQIHVVHLQGSESTTLNVDRLGIIETEESIRGRVTSENFCLRGANQLFVSGDFMAALGIYKSLGQGQRLSIYSDNAIRAARYLGMSWVTSIQDLPD